jgi:hypothetical protein
VDELYSRGDSVTCLRAQYGKERKFYSHHIRVLHSQVSRDLI